MTAYTKRDTNKRKDTNPKSIARTDSKRAAILIYIWAKFLSRIMRVYGGGFRLAIIHVYICGKIFALHNTHIEHGENPKIIIQKLSRIYKNFRQKDIYMWAIFKTSYNTPILDPKSFSL